MTEGERKRELRRIDAIEIIHKAKYDWRVSTEIAAIQGQAVAQALANCGNIESIDSEADIPGWIARISQIAADAILAENRKHVDEIRTAIKELEKWALTDEEVDKLLA